MNDPSPPDQGQGPSALQTVAQSVPAFDAAGVLIIVLLWWAGLSNLHGLEGYVQVVIIVVLLVVTLFFGSKMQERFRLARSTPPDAAGERVLRRLSTDDLTAQEYRNELESLPEIRGSQEQRQRQGEGQP